MRNFKLEIEYDGTHYYGWQVQNGKKAKAAYRNSQTIQQVLEKVLKKILQEDIKLTVAGRTDSGVQNGKKARASYRNSQTIQQVLEEVLKRILQEDIRLTVAGRTDSGVHALAQVANFKSLSRMPLEKLHWAVNCLLPEDIKVTRIKNVGLDFNSRFSAKFKLYRYTILNRKYSSALSANRVYFFHHHLNVSLMRREAKVLLGRHNFTSFQATETRQRNPWRTIRMIKISKDKDLLHIDIQADSFLYNMVRNIAGTLLEIGRGRFSRGSMKNILKACNRKLAGPTLPAKGLFLLKVRY